MSRSLGNILADSLQLGIGYAERLLKEVPAEQFARFARPGGVVVESNHGAFVLGHLSLYPTRILEQLEGNAGAVAPPARFVEAFSKDALRAAPDAAFSAPNPAGGRMAELFPTLGSMQAFYVGGHLMMHLGQMSAWRRMLGLKPA